MHSVFIKVSGEDKKAVKYWAESLAKMFGNSFIAIEEGLEVKVVKNNEKPTTR